MFRRLTPGGPPVTFRFDGVEIAATAGDTVAAALLAAGRAVSGVHPVSGAPRGPFCMMGACHECLVEVAGISVQACQLPVSDGLEVRSLPRPGRFAGDAS